MASEQSMPNGRHDARARRRSQRQGRRKGCFVYITAEDLVDAGFNPADPPPFYLTAGHQRSRNAGSVIVSLYREP